MNNINHPGKVMDCNCSILLLVACKEYGSPIWCGRSPLLETWKLRKINRIYMESISDVNLGCESRPNSINSYKISVYSKYILHKISTSSPQNHFELILWPPLAFSFTVLILLNHLIETYLKGLRQKKQHNHNWKDNFSREKNLSANL